MVLLLQVKDITNEGETEFLKILNLGQRLLERTLGKLRDQKFLPGKHCFYKSVVCALMFYKAKVKKKDFVYALYIYFVM